MTQRGNGMDHTVNLGGSFTLPGSSLRVNRMGYGAMQLAGRDGNKLVWGPPRDGEEAVRVLQEEAIPQRLKPDPFWTGNGTVEAAPFQSESSFRKRVNSRSESSFAS
ncbi:MAG: hypothetical protein WBW84_23950 [Acidobacteriaceae bacterium]